MKDILVIGESCRDIFVYCDCTRLCPDIPVPVLKVVNQTENVGMAKNVQRNILSLNQQCDIITNDDWFNVTKTRFVHNDTNHMFIRVDTDHNIKAIDITKIDYNYKYIVISDYNKGFLNEETIEQICNKHNFVFLDTKKILGSWAKKAKIIKINNYEYSRSIEHIDTELQNKIIHTKGGEGCFYRGENFRVDKVEVKDVSGCGDTFLASLVVEFGKNNNITDAIKFANQCASEVARHRGVTTVNI